MKNSLLFPLLSLFLLVPASITRAQVTKTLNGTVRYESGMSKTTFETPKGNVAVVLPQSMSGAKITGTVSVEPTGKTEKEKNRNLKELLQYVVMLDGQKIPLTASPANFDWLTHQDRPSRTPMELLNVSGTKVAETSLPRVLPAPATMGGWQSNNSPVLNTPSNVLVKGDALNVYTDQQFSPGEKFVITDSKGHQFTVTPLCLSSNQAVMTVPSQAVPGKLNVVEETRAATTVQTENGWLSCNLVDINLSSPNTNLRPGQNSEVLAVVIITDSSGGWVSPDLEDLLNTPLMSVDLRNLNPNIVTMEGGNIQRVYLGQSKANAAAGGYRIKRAITGNAVGSFSVSATLHEDYTTSNDPFRPQLNALNTPEDFNRWASALKNDLGQYATVIGRFWGDDKMPTLNMKKNIQRAIDNMPVCTDPGQLDESKAVAYSLVQPLNVPKGAAISWPSSYEAFKASLDGPGNMTDGGAMTDRDILENGLLYIERLGYKGKDPSLTQDAGNAIQHLNTTKKSGETKENLDRLFETIRSISARADQLSRSNEASRSWSLKELGFDSYCLDKRTKDGVDPATSTIACIDPYKKTLNVKPEYQQQVLTSLHARPAANGGYLVNAVSQSMVPVTCEIRILPLVTSGVFDSDWWAEHLIEQYLKKDTSRGNIITTTKDSTGTYYVFYKDAKCEVDSYSSKEESSDCFAETDWDPKEQKSHPTGRYEKITCYKTATCKKGTDFCTEVYVVTCTTQIFMDAKCTRRIKTVDSKHFSCL